MKKTSQQGIVVGLGFYSWNSVMTNKFAIYPSDNVFLSGLTVLLLSLSSFLFAGVPALDLPSGSDQLNGHHSNNSASSLLLDHYSSSMMIPNVTVRFANPQWNCVMDEYCVDVEFQTNMDSVELFGMNVRFFYDDVLLEIDSIRDFQGGYGPPSAPNPVTSGPGFGTTFFGFASPGIADWVNTPISLLDGSQPPIYISTTGWTKLFQICFNIEGEVDDSSNFCPSLVWDLEVNPANGGYLGGDDGVVITVVAPPPANSGPANENVVQFNWMYTGSGSSPPYGAPTETDCIDIICWPPIAITCPADLTIACGGSTLPGNTGFASGVGGCSDPLLVTYTDSLTSEGCGVLSQIFRTWIASDTCGIADTCIQILTLTDVGSIYGTVYDDLGDPMAGVQIILMADLNANQTVDGGDTLFAVTLTDSVTGEFGFTQIPPCLYVIKEAMAEYHALMSDYDQTPDPDGDDQEDGPDLEIPVALAPCETDSNNNIVNILCPNVFPTLPSDTICEDESVVLEIEDLNIGLLTYTWDFGGCSDPVVGIGLGPHNIQYAGTTENQTTGASVSLTIGKSGCPDTTAQVCVIKVNPYPDATINGSTNAGCYYTDRIFQPVQPELPGATYQWNFGYGAVPPNANGYGPHTVYYDTAGTKIVTLAIHPNEAGAQCPDSSSLSFMINNCPANIIGNVKTIYNTPIPSVNIRLYHDVDTNGIADDTIAVRSVNTLSNGNYSMASLLPGNYVIVQVQPTGWYSYDDGDPTPDNDIVANVDSLDNIIPVTLVASIPPEVDGVNSFIEGPVSGNITGNVFDDFDVDQFPDAGEGIGGVDIKLFADNNTDGIPDSNIPVLTTATLSNGNYQFLGVPVGNYVLVEYQTAEFVSIKDFDASDDADQVPNTDIHDDTIPVTLLNGELDAHNYFIDVPLCGTIVTNVNDEGSGSLREVIECVPNNGTVLFHPNLDGATISINSARLVINKNVVIFSDCDPPITLASQIDGFFDITTGSAVEFSGLNIISGLSGNLGAAFKNDGILTLNNVTVLRNPLLPAGQYLIYNSPASQLFLLGNCFIEMD